MSGKEREKKNFGKLEQRKGQSAECAGCRALLAALAQERLRAHRLGLSRPAGAAMPAKEYSETAIRGANRSVKGIETIYHFEGGCFTFANLSRSKWGLPYPPVVPLQRELRTLLKKRGGEHWFFFQK